MTFALQNPVPERVNLAIGGVNLGQIYVNLEATGICESGIRLFYHTLNDHFQIPRESGRESVNLENTPTISGRYSRFTDSQNPTLPTGERDALRRSLLQRSRELRLDMIRDAPNPVPTTRKKRRRNL